MAKNDGNRKDNQHRKHDGHETQHGPAGTHGYRHHPHTHAGGRRHPEVTGKEESVEAISAGPERAELEASEAVAALEAGEALDALEAGEAVDALEPSPERSALEAGKTSEAIGGRGPRTLRDEAAHELNRLTRRTMRLRRRRHGSQGRDSTSGQGRVLKLLGMSPRMTQRDLTYILDVSRQSMAETLAKLEDQGLVNRKQAVEDRRVTVIELTEEGRQHAADMEKQTDIVESALEDFTDLEISQLTQYLARINASLKMQATLGESSSTEATEHHCRGRRHDGRRDTDRHYGSREDRGGSQRRRRRGHPTPKGR